MDNFSFTTFVWTKDYLESILFEGKHKLIYDPYIMQGFRSIDRAHFVPDKYRAITYEDKDIDIGFGQKLYKPTTSAKLINFLNPKPMGNYLVVGGGTGYLSAIIGSIVTSKGRVIALERILMILDIFRHNLANYPQLKDIVEPVFKDGIEGYKSNAPYDGILYSVALEANPLIVISQLKVGGKMIVPRNDGSVRILTRIDNTNWSEQIYKNPLLIDNSMNGIE
ncbi:hypothetical protein KBD45_07915 [Candidatus Dojkabacteria bacterium]|nr:hypothetical protein [Candidatus Dojkabacteria bacterium]